MIFLKRNNNPYLLTSLPLFALTLHQVEEYIISPALFGEAYHFLNWAYRSGLEILPVEVVVINLGAITVAMILYLFKPSTKLFALIFLFVNSMSLANAALHLGVATLQTDFSPGMITSVLFFVPLFVKSVLISSEKLVPINAIFALSICGFIVHFGLIARLNIF